MKYLLILLSFLLTVGAIPLSAQNKIDDMVDTYYAMGKSTLTSAVERDNKTKKITKVVKVLDVDKGYVNSFIKAFEEEKSKSASYKQTLNGNEVTTVLTTENDKSNRIYMLQYNVSTGTYTTMPAFGSPFKVSIVVKFKKSK